MTAVSSTISPLALIFSVNDNLMTRALDGLSEAELLEQVTPRNNPILPIVAHAVVTRAFMLSRLGEPVDTGWGAEYARGAAFSREACPSRSDVLRVHADIGQRIQQKLASLDETQLAASALESKLPGVKTVADMIGFFALHDSYHVGQMAFVRKALGHPALVG